VEEIEHIIRQPANRAHRTPILLQHGAWHGAWCWEYWLDYFASLGYEVHAISLPGHGSSSLNKGHTNLYTLCDYVGTLAHAVDTIAPAPVVVGHSMGGAILQKYLERHRLPGAVFLATLPTSGMWGMILRLVRRHPAAILKGMLTLDTYHWVGTPELARDLFLGTDTAIDVDRFHKRLVRESVALGLQLMFPFARLNKTASPVLVLAGEKDAIFTLAEERATAEKYKGAFVLFEGQAHNLMLGPARQRVANTIDEWITSTLNLP